MADGDIEMEVDQEKEEVVKPSTSGTNQQSLIFHQPWIEKYRPVKFSDVIGNEFIVKTLEGFSKEGNMPNILISGPPGVGKTTTVMCLARILLGPAYKDAVLELNASNDRGIEVVRNKIKMFAQKKVTLPKGKCKVIILDEADSLTDGAQQALKRTMESYTNTTRFVLACNNSGKVIAPLQSRCAVLRCSKLTDSQVLSALLDICEKENVSYNESGLEALVFTAQGDMRQAINNLQSTFSGFGHVTNENVFKVCDEPHPLLIKDMLGHCLKGDIDEAYKILSYLWKLGYCAEDIFKTLNRVCKEEEMPEYLKVEYLKELLNFHLKLTRGLRSLVQMSGLLAKFCLLATNAPEN